MSKDIFVKYINKDFIEQELINIGFDSSYRHHACKKNTYKTIKIFNLRPQEASIFRTLSVEDNIKAVLEMVIEEEDQRETMLEELLNEFSISHLRKSPALALSGGERRRLEIARALASQPNYILLDEPLAGIDPIAVGEIRALVSQLKNRGLGVLITDHNVRETLDIIDRAYILHGGTVLMEGTPSEIVANEEVRKVYLGDTFSM